MKLFVLGEPLFLGHHIGQATLDRRHDVTLFNLGHAYLLSSPTLKSSVVIAREISVPVVGAPGIRSLQWRLIW